MSSTKDILEHHLECFGKGNLHGILADYSADALLLIPTGPLKGLDALRSFFQAMFAEFAKPGASFTMLQQHVEGDYAYILWSAESADNRYDFATDTFVMRNGKIVAQSFAANIVPKR
jgi:ketosteroid isomerase-like protein